MQLREQIVSYDREKLRLNSQLFEIEIQPFKHYNSQQKQWQLISGSVPASLDVTVQPKLGVDEQQAEAQLWRQTITKPSILYQPVNPNRL